MLTETVFGTSPVVAPSLVVINAAISGSGASVTTGANVGIGARVGQGVGLGQRVAAGDGETLEVSAKALTVSRWATRSQATTKLIRLRAMMVALNPLPTLVPGLRARGLLVVIAMVLMVFMIIVVMIIVVVILVPPVVIVPATPITGGCRLTRSDLIVGGL